MEIILLIILVVIAGVFLVYFTGLLALLHAIKYILDEWRNKWE